MAKNYVDSVNLASCPFCGHEARMEKTKAYCLDAFRASCTHCHINTGIITAGGTVKHGEWIIVTLEDALQEALGKWNTRINSDRNVVHPHNNLQRVRGFLNG